MNNTEVLIAVIVPVVLTAILAVSYLLYKLNKK